MEFYVLCPYLILFRAPPDIHVGYRLICNVITDHRRAAGSLVNLHCCKAQIKKKNMFMLDTLNSAVQLTSRTFATPPVASWSQALSGKSFCWSFFELIFRSQAWTSEVRVIKQGHPAATGEVIITATERVWLVTLQEVQSCKWTNFSSPQTVAHRVAKKNLENRFSHDVKSI